MSGLYWIDLGQWPPRLAVTFDKAAYDEWMEDVNEPHPFPPSTGHGATQLLTKNGGEGVIFIAVCYDRDQSELACTLAHEAVHAARFLFDYVGEDRPSKEAEAYLIEHIFRHAMKAAKQHRKSSKARSSPSP